MVRVKFLCPMDVNLLTPGAALVVGLATSLHCTAMCGPLACALRVRPTGYHLSRFFSYTLAGALVGLAGSSLASAFHHGATLYLPWLLVTVLLMVGFGLEKKLPQPRALSKLLLRVRLQHSLGWLTPLLPCGPLWLMLGTAALAGSWQHGAILMACFVIGTIPLPWVILTQGANLQRRFSPIAMRRTQQCLAFISAGLLAWRALLPIDAPCH